MLDATITPAMLDAVFDAISYKRFSSTKQASGNSDNRQTDQTEDYIARKGYRLIEAHLDASASGFYGANLSETGKLRLILDQARAGRYRPGTRLVIEALDRLTRQELDIAIELFLGITRTGLVIATVFDDQEYDRQRIRTDMTALILAIVLMMGNHKESEIKRNRSLDNRKSERDRAQTSVGPNDVGIPVSKIAPAWINVVIERDAPRAKDRIWRFELDLTRSAVVRRIWEDAASGLGIIQITAGLNDDKVPTFGKSDKWTRGAVQNILADDAAIGLYQPMRYERDGDDVPGEKRSRAKRGRRVRNGDAFAYYPAAISPDLYRRAKAAMARNHKGGRGRHGSTYSNLLKGLCECGICQGAVHHLDRPGPHSYMKCQRATVRACSNQEPFPYHRLEPLLYRLHELYQGLANMLPRPIDRSAEIIAALENKLDRLNQKERSLYETFGDGSDRPNLKLTIDRIHDEIKNLNRQLDDARHQAHVSAAHIERSYVERFIEAVRGAESTDPKERLRRRGQIAAEYRRIIERVVFEPGRTVRVLIKRRACDGIQVEYLVSPERIENWFIYSIEGTKLVANDVFFDPTIPIDMIREHAYRHVRAKSDDLYNSATASTNR